MPKPWRIELGGPNARPRADVAQRAPLILNGLPAMFCCISGRDRHPGRPTCRMHPQAHSSFPHRGQCRRGPASNGRQFSGRGEDAAVARAHLALALGPACGQPPAPRTTRQGRGWLSGRRGSRLMSRGGGISHTSTRGSPGASARIERVPPSAPRTFGDGGAARSASASQRQRQGYGP